MSQYNIGDIVLVKSGFDEIICKYRIVNKRYLDRQEIEEVIEFKFEYNNYEKNINDPYMYYVTYDEDNICMEMDNIKFFRNMYLINSQIIGKSN